MTARKKGAAPVAPDGAPDLYLPLLARAAADRRAARKKPLSRAEALAEAPWDDSMPAGWQRAFRAAYADRLLERGLALPSSEGRSGPSGPSGRALHPEMRVRVPEADQERYRKAAARSGMNLSEWVRRACEGAAK